MGWTYEQDRGRLAIEKQFGSQIETKYVENVPEGPDAERVIRQYAMAGFDMIFTTSFGYMDPTVAVAKEFPTSSSSTAPATRPPPTWRPISAASRKPAT